MCVECFERIKIAYDIKVKSIETLNYFKEELAKAEMKYEHEQFEVEYLDNYTETPEDSIVDAQPLVSDVPNEKVADQSPLVLTENTNLDKRCFICNVVLKSVKEKYKHVREIHYTQIGVYYECPICQPIYKSRVAITMNQHLRTHFIPPEWKCSTCGKAFSKKMHLNRHFEHSHMKRVFTCDRCGKTFSYRNNLTRHMTTTHLAAKLKCDFPNCEKSFSRKSNLSWHRIREHKESTPFKCSGEFYCHKHLKVSLINSDLILVCDLGFVFSYELKNHFNKEGICPHSDVISRLKSDTNEIMSQKKNFKCPICLKVFLHHYCKFMTMNNS